MADAGAQRVLTYRGPGPRSEALPGGWLLQLGEPPYHEFEPVRDVQMRCSAGAVEYVCGPRARLWEGS